MTHHELTFFFLAISVLLLFARIFGEVATKLGQPAVLGEILAGIILGPTVFGTFAPDMYRMIFLLEGNFKIAFEAITSLAIVLFLLIAGLEIDLSSVFRQGRNSIVISAFGMAIPFGVGFLCAYYMPMTFGAHEGSDELLFALFVGTALAISALPVIAKTLFDLGLYRSDFGMLIISVAVIDDLAGWMLFALILGLMGGGHDGFSVPMTVGLTLLFAFFILTFGRWIINRILPVVQAYTTWPGGVLGFAVIGGLFCATFTEWVGIHGIFGAFLFGVALGDSNHLREKTRHTLDNFISFIFAPLFFASIGLRVNFATHFDLKLVVLVLVIASIGKLVGCGLGSRLVKITWRESFAVGVGMNARGAMEIILALLALQAGLIRERMFVALVVMALVTSMMAGGIMEKLLQRRKVTRFFHYIPNGGYVADIKAGDRLGAITELAEVACKGLSIACADATAAVWQREQSIPTGMGHGIAIPHARLPGLKTPVVVLGRSKHGIDFDAPDGEKARLIFLILTPAEVAEFHLEVLSDIATTFRDGMMRDAVMRADSHVQFMAALKAQ